ncbi:SDR family NAD(P)-dependent oxidoreductase [Rhabdothermincola sediminis]|uniref:SDR family NAD(P)-dependent oxidoreductase n=1 Tax=Rhabdothermincola sediminis TaxID=2751370 RepID=UPI001AA08461|nr:SDR family NAD(P)-dependent oxidoreductase [Rhabdothermincola sediminis]
MGYDVDGKRVLVTGASAGIGSAVARGMAERGAIVGICARRADRLAEVLDDCQRYSPQSRSWVVDLADLDRVSSFALEADDALGGIDVLVNNAGIPKRRKVQALTVEEIDAVMGLNYLSPVRLILALLPRMLARAAEGREPAHIVNISSVAARLSPPGEAAYAASKAALTAFSECLAAELWDQPVDVHLINPGVIDTELFELPGNDPLLATDIEPLPPALVADLLVEQLDRGAFELYVPEWFRDLFAVKAGDIEGFIAGAAEYQRQREAEAGAEAGIGATPET